MSTTTHKSDSNFNLSGWRIGGSAPVLQGLGTEMGFPAYLHIMLLEGIIGAPPKGLGEVLGADCGGAVLELQAASKTTTGGVCLQGQEHKQRQEQGQGQVGGKCRGAHSNACI